MLTDNDKKLIRQWRAKLEKLDDAKTDKEIWVDRSLSLFDAITDLIDGLNGVSPITLDGFLHFADLKVFVKTFVDNQIQSERAKSYLDDLPGFHTSIANRLSDLTIQQHQFVDVQLCFVLLGREHYLHSKLIG